MTGVGASGRIARAFIDNKLSPLLAIAALVLGLLAVVATPREEEPQIVVPMIDARSAGRRRGRRRRALGHRTPSGRSARSGVEYIYATTQPSGPLIARFLVNRSRARADQRDKVSNVHAALPAGVTAPQVVAR
jgi:multidrug efflux pump subunit AcrB